MTQKAKELGIKPTGFSCIEDWVEEALISWMMDCPERKPAFYRIPSYDNFHLIVDPYLQASKKLKNKGILPESFYDDPVYGFENFSGMITPVTI